MYVVVGSRLRGCGCRIFCALAKSGTVSCMGRISPSLVILSLVLPFIDKSTLLDRVQGFSSVPIVIISTGDLAFGGVRLLHLKTSSCLIGPFSLSRLLTQVRHGLREYRGRTRALRVMVNGLFISATSGAIVLSSSTVSLATQRCRVLRLLVQCPKGMFSGRGLCRDV